jgi:glycosyltransferase involved in cell wall biosynthesis
MSISVVIPAYNASAFLAETLRSVLAQTHPPSEVLVIDDGSTDDTAEIAESFGPSVRVFRRPNSRQGASRNFGVQQATSDWIAFLDADDLWEPNKLERQMQQLACEPRADLCYTGRTTFTVRDGVRHFISTIPGPPDREIRDALFKRCTFLPSTVLIRKSTFLAVGGYATHFKIAEDWDLWLRLLHSGARFTGCPEPLLLYRMHDSNVSSNGLLLLEENIQNFRNHILPHLSGLRRLFAINRFYGENQAAAAHVLRKQKDPRCLGLMARSIVRLPFENPYRYRAFAHMLYTQATGGFKTVR